MLRLTEFLGSAFSKAAPVCMHQDGQVVLQSSASMKLLPFVIKFCGF